MSNGLETYITERFGSSSMVCSATYMCLGFVPKTLPFYPTSEFHFANGNEHVDHAVNLCSFDSARHMLVVGKQLCCV